jgi:hypothetical protein
VATVAVAARREVVLDNSLGELSAALQIQTE